MSLRQRFHLIGALFLFFGLVSGSWFPWLFGGFFFFMTGFHRWWRKNLPRWITFTLEAEQSRVMPETEVPVRLTLTNRSWLPLPYTRIQFSLPEHVSVEGADSAAVNNKRTVVQLWISVPRHSKAERTFVLRPHKRGYIWLSEIHAEMIDPLGEESCEIDPKLSFSLLVYPHTLSIPPFAPADTEPIGRRLSRQRLQEDVTFLRGLRPYAAGDRLKHIDWKATAKTGAMQTRQFEFSSHANWRIIGHILPSYEPLLQRHNDEVNERTISHIASAAVRCRREALSYELLLNVRQRGKEYFQLAKGSGKSHHVQVMTHLARLNQYIPTKLAALLRRLEQSREKEAILIISPRIDEAAEQAIGRLVRRGHTVVIMDLSKENTVCRQAEPTRLWKEELVHEG